MSGGGVCGPAHGTCQRPAIVRDTNNFPYTTNLLIQLVSCTCIADNEIIFFGICRCYQSSPLLRALAENDLIGEQRKLVC